MLFTCGRSWTYRSYHLYSTVLMSSIPLIVGSTAQVNEGIWGEVWVTVILIWWMSSVDMRCVCVVCVCVCVSVRVFVVSTHLSHKIDDICPSITVSPSYSMQLSPYILSLFHWIYFFNSQFYFTQEKCTYVTWIRSGQKKRRTEMPCSALWDGEC